MSNKKAKLHQKIGGELVGGSIVCPACKSPSMRTDGAWLGFDEDGTPDGAASSGFRGSISGKVGEKIESEMECASTGCGSTHTLVTVFMPSNLSFGNITMWGDFGIVELLDERGNIYSAVNGKLKRGRIQ